MAKPGSSHLRCSISWRNALAGAHPPMTLSSFFSCSRSWSPGVIQYGLAIYAIRDLTRREQLRGANEVTWTLIVLCLPFIGPLLYAMLATDGLPIPKPAPDSTWPGRRWRVVQRFGRRGSALPEWGRGGRANPIRGRISPSAAMSGATTSSRGPDRVQHVRL
ncbi:MAG: PLD nuclease N-terminal domain-containing protein [Thermomicrobiales bacterium]